MKRLPAAVALALSLTLPATALAGGPGRWSRVSPENLRNIDEAALVRAPDGALVGIWTAPGAGSSQDLVSVRIAAAGAAGPIVPVTQGWSTITNLPDVVPGPGGTLRALFGGLRTTSPDEPNDELSLATAPGSGSPWTLKIGNVAAGNAAYASDVGAANLPDGTPLISWGGTGTGVFTHRGLDPATPNFPLQDQLGGCCGYSPDVAVDRSSGRPFVAWYSNSAQLGVFVQALDPGTGAPQGAPAKMPGSTTLFQGRQQSSQQLSRTPIVARVGGGVFVAYSGGYPTATDAILWRVGAPRQTVVDRTRSGHIVGAAADPAGRVWVFWIETGARPVVWAARSNRAVTRFGRKVRAGQPRGAQSGYRIDGDAQAGRLDLVALFNTGGSAQAQWHTQVLPGLRLGATPARIRGSRSTAVTFTVTDPDPVPGATVRALGERGTTGANGRVTLVLGPTGRRRATATATKPGYSGARRAIRVRR